MSAQNMLSARGLYQAYGAIPVLKNVDIDVRPGETHVVIGPNGAGKTTLFKVLSGELLANGGSVQFDGGPVERLDGFRRVRMGMGRTFQVARVFGEDTVLANMVVAVEARQRQLGRLSLARWRVSPSREVLDESLAMLSRMGLAEKQHQRAGVLAYGDRKRLELAIALALQPRLLMLDEPMAGMSPSDRAAAVELIRQIAREHGLSVLLTEHDMDVVFALAHRITVLNYGEVIASGSPEEVRASAVVRDVYLGHEAQHA
jgi:branched-chain amino acid transport system ATP-binding protein